MTRISLRRFLTWILSSPFLFVLAQQPGSFETAGDTQISAMMMFLGNEEKVYILDKAENNSATINNHPAWGAVWDISSNTATVMEVYTNTFCSSGSHLPNGSYVTFGGNGAIGPGGGPPDVSPIYDSVYQDWSGSTSIRILNPCTGSDLSSPNCQWFDNASLLAMQKHRWYSGAEALADGSIAIIGGFVNGGYINRNTINTDPLYEGGGAEPTYEFFPSKGEATIMNFLGTTSGLNAYPLTYLMPSGKMFVQANLSTMLWDWTNNTEYALPDMPNNTPRVYPASGANAMLPLTPATNYTPTILFCGGTDMSWEDFGNYSSPTIDTFYYPASRDCQRITPEPADGSSPEYVQDDDMPEGRTMGQFIALPDGTMLLINGARNGTGGSSTSLPGRPSLGFMPYGESLAAGPIGTPLLYDPNAPVGGRWLSTALGSSNIARLFHSSAILLPDASVLVAGSNPNFDVNLTTIYPTTYTAERFYPPYFSASTRPVPSGVPTNISYGGPYFNISVSSSSYSGSVNDAAGHTTVVLIRPGFTTHAMNMGQRYLQLNNTYTINDDGSIILHVSQAPPNPNILQPGPCLLFVVVNGIPSNGTMVIIGNGEFGTQPTDIAAALPVSGSAANATGSPGSASSTPTHNHTKESSHTGAIIGGAVGGLAALCIAGAFVGIYFGSRRTNKWLAKQPYEMPYRYLSVWPPLEESETGSIPLQTPPQSAVPGPGVEWDGAKMCLSDGPDDDQPSSRPGYVAVRQW